MLGLKKGHKKKTSSEGVVLDVEGGSEPLLENQNEGSSERNEEDLSTKLSTLRHRVITSGGKENESALRVSREDSSFLGFHSEEQGEETSSKVQCKVSFFNLDYSVPDRIHEGETKHILDNVSGILSPSEVVAIMGPSGCGKTTLLEILGGRNAPSRGIVMMNDKLYNNNTKRQVGFVPQEEVLFSTLTVRETLELYGSLRLPSHISKDERLQRVNKVLQELNIEKVADALIGDAYSRGISGGERKRVSIGMELLATPSLLLLDEPTSGLDSFTSTKVVFLLKKLARKGRTVACSIHQPNSDIYAAFDKLILLVAGSVIYNGPASHAVGYFSDLGYTCPQYANPADFFLSLCEGGVCKDGQPRTSFNDDAINSSQWSNDQVLMDTMEEKKEDSTHETNPASDGEEDRFMNKDVKDSSSLSTFHGTLSPILRELIDAYKSSSLKKGIEQGKIDLYQVIAQNMQLQQSSSKEESFTEQYPTSFCSQFQVLSRRAMINSRRNPLSTKVALFRTLFMALLVGSLYYQIKPDENGPQAYQGALFFILTNQIFSQLSALRVLLDEKVIIAHESKSGIYRISAYYMAKQFAELPVMIFLALLFSVIAYWLMFNTKFSTFAIFTVTVIITNLVAESYVLFCGSITTDDKVAQVIAPVILTLFMLFSGLFINLSSLPTYYGWIQYCSFMNYLYAAFMKNIFLQGQPHGVPFDGAYCQNGEDCINQLNLNSFNTADNLLMALLIGFIFRCVGFLFVRKNFRPAKFVLASQDTTQMYKETSQMNLSALSEQV